MATRCIDISENRKLTTISPIAVFAFIGGFIVLTAIMEPGFTYVLAITVWYLLTQIFFQFSPRFVFMMIKFLLTNSKLSPSFEDRAYQRDHKSIQTLKRILPID